ncbi:nucleotidyltransferase domain-containing protein [Guptibacillus sedimenti]|uniref:nucleotidyltransferase domain-containing protein n=1 Tax=Guptibacillus sedimenti TaxID=3025680 RepID=UPI0023625C06|nr:nucleotidyltransferase domain-containing protein [Pseudalkalibacillus sedimenti]
MNAIKPIGSFYAVNEEGYLVNDTSREKVGNYRNAINRAVEILTLKVPLQSIYLRGSVPKGKGIEGISDLDIIVLTEHENEQIAEFLNQIITDEFPWVNGCEVSFISQQELEPVTCFSIIPFMIKTSSLLVYGNDVAKAIPNYKPDRALANDHLIQLENHINQAKRELVGNEDVEDIADCCGWIMKIIVRSGLALVMEKDPKYTRDLYPAYTLFSNFFPHKESCMKQALIYAVYPIKSREEITQFLDQFGGWLIQEANDWLNEYNPERVWRLSIE